MPAGLREKSGKALILGRDFLIDTPDNRESLLNTAPNMGSTKR